MKPQQVPSPPASDNDTAQLLGQRPEFTVAAEYLAKHLPVPALRPKFKDAVIALMQRQYAGLWHPETPLRGNAARAISIPPSYLQPSAQQHQHRTQHHHQQSSSPGALRKSSGSGGSRVYPSDYILRTALAQAAPEVSYVQYVQNLSPEFIMWIDPYCVAYRFNDGGQVLTLYEDRTVLRSLMAAAGSPNAGSSVNGTAAANGLGTFQYQNQQYQQHQQLQQQQQLQGGDSDAMCLNRMLNPSEVLIGGHSTTPIKIRAANGGPAVNLQGGSLSPETARLNGMIIGGSGALRPSHAIPITARPTTPPTPSSMSNGASSGGNAWSIGSQLAAVSPPPHAKA
ncbi:hypothetical protein GQ42DRAFT_181457 [Ramicandelaber brevisporus]|nr:hypothetical protein GQ42DRAFT_181457 [Ramicandelaber brevisporus]